jgi:hypothetical protein
MTKNTKLIEALETISKETEPVIEYIDFDYERDCK